MFSEASRQMLKITLVLFGKIVHSHAKILYHWRQEFLIRFMWFNVYIKSMFLQGKVLPSGMRWQVDYTNELSFSAVAKTLLILFGTKGVFSSVCKYEQKVSQGFMCKVSECFQVWMKKLFECEVKWMMKAWFCVFTTFE